MIKREEKSEIKLLGVVEKVVNSVIRPRCKLIWKLSGEDQSEVDELLTVIHCKRIEPQSLRINDVLTSVRISDLANHIVSESAQTVSAGLDCSVSFSLHWLAGRASFDYAACTEADQKASNNGEGDTHVATYRQAVLKRRVLLMPWR